jgi:hypothetical protein
MPFAISASPEQTGYWWGRTSSVNGLERKLLFAAAGV